MIGPGFVRLNPLIADWAMYAQLQNTCFGNITYKDRSGVHPYTVKDRLMARKIQYSARDFDVNQAEIRKRVCPDILAFGQNSFMLTVNCWESKKWNEPATSYLISCM